MSTRVFLTWYKMHTNVSVHGCSRKEELLRGSSLLRFSFAFIACGRNLWRNKFVCVCVLKRSCLQGHSSKGHCHCRVVITQFNMCWHVLTYKMASCVLVYTDPTRVNVTKSSFWTVLIDATLFGTSLHHSSEMPRWHMRRQARNKLLFIKKRKGKRKAKSLLVIGRSLG